MYCAKGRGIDAKGTILVPTVEVPLVLLRLEGVTSREQRSLRRDGFRGAEREYGSRVKR